MNLRFRLLPRGVSGSVKMHAHASLLVLVWLVVIASASPAWAGQALREQAQALRNANVLPGTGRSTDTPAQTASPQTTPTGNVVARLAQNVVSIDETITLTVTAMNVDGELDTAALERAFDLVGRSRSSQIEVINGVRRESRSWALELSPRSVGVFTVPAVSVGGVDSDLQTLEVTDPPTGADRELFLEVDVDTRNPWVQSQVLLTLRVFDAVDILEGALGEPAGADLVVQRLDDDRRSTVERDGRSYAVTERRYALFPQSSGPLVIEPIALNASVPTQPSRVRGFFTPSKRVTRRSAPVTLDVRARPPGQVGWWLPAGAIELQAQWLAGQTSGAASATIASPQRSDTPIEATVGVPLTRVLTLRALGVLESQLPTIAVPQVDGASLYADTPAVSGGAGSRGIVTEQQLSWAIIPERQGTLELPAVELEWFDTSSGEARTAALPPVRLDVRAAPASTTANAPTDARDAAGAIRGNAPPGPVRSDVPEVPVGERAGSALATLPLAALERQSSFWRAAAALAAAAWLATAIAWLVFARRSRSAGQAQTQPEDAQGPASRRRALALLRRQDRAMRPRAQAEAALDWGRARWPTDPPASLTALAARLGDVPAARTLRRLDASLYGASPSGSCEANAAFSTLGVELEAEEQALSGRAAASPSALPTL